MSHLVTGSVGVRKAGYTCWEDGGTGACALESVGHNFAGVGLLYNLYSVVWGLKLLILYNIFTVRVHLQHFYELRVVLRACFV